MKLNEYGKWTVIGLPEDSTLTQEFLEWNQKYNAANSGGGYSHPPSKYLQLPKRVLIAGHLSREQVLVIQPHARYYLYLIHAKRRGMSVKVDDKWASKID